MSLSNPTIEAPFNPPILPQYTETPKKMATLWVTDYVANTAILVYKRANYLSYNITPDMVICFTETYNTSMGIPL